MENKSFSTTIEISKSQEEVFNCITEVTKWWSKDFEGNSKKLNDEFIIHHPNQHYSKQRLIEVVPNKKIAWLVTESTLYWLKKDQQEWTNTKMIFEIRAKDKKTILQFTHDGLLPEMEYYQMCEKGWTLVIKDWLFYYIMNGTASPEMAKAAKIREQSLKENKSFNCTISVNIPAKEAIEKMNKVTEWWGVKCSGEHNKQNDKFVINMSGDSFFNMTISELIPNQKLIWKVTDCNMPWFTNKKEWADTEIIFDLIEHDGTTTIKFTHEGLTPVIECYKACESGWTHWIERSLFSYLSTGVGDFKQR